MRAIREAIGLEGLLCGVLTAAGYLMLPQADARERIWGGVLVCAALVIGSRWAAELMRVGRGATLLSVASVALGVIWVSVPGGRTGSLGVLVLFLYGWLCGAWTSGIRSPRLERRQAGGRGQDAFLSALESAERAGGRPSGAARDSGRTFGDVGGLPGDQGPEGLSWGEAPVVRRAAGWVAMLAMALAITWGLAALIVARTEVARTVAEVLGGGYSGLDWPSAAFWALAALLSCVLVAGTVLGIRRLWPAPAIAAVLATGPFCLAFLWVVGIELPLARALGG